jgi:hypothetical protein
VSFFYTDLLQYRTLIRCTRDGYWTAEYYVTKGYDVYVLNRNTKEQSKGVTLIEADRHNLGETLREYRFDTVIDTAYTGDDVELLLNALGDYENYILISSSAVYPEYAPQPFKEYAHLSINKYWGKYENVSLTLSVGDIAKVQTAPIGNASNTIVKAGKTTKLIFFMLCTSVYKYRFLFYLLPDKLESVALIPVVNMFPISTVIPN